MTSLNQKLTALVREATIATAAATLCALVLQVPVWAMFIGWIAFFTRGMTAKDGVINLLTVWIGIAIGIAAGQLTSVLTPLTGEATLSLVVFVVALVVLSLRYMPVVNNLLGLFLGLVSFFASHQPPNFETFFTLALAATVGIVAATSLRLMQLKTAVAH